MSAVYEAWQAGFVRRWHANPDMSHVHDEIAAHQGRCLVLAIQLFPDADADLLRAIAMHDLAERWVGDLPYDFKLGVGSVAAAAHQVAENRVARSKGFQPVLTKQGCDRLKLVDRLDAYLIMLKWRSNLALRVDWVESLNAILELADRLGVVGKVEALISAAIGRPPRGKSVTSRRTIRAYFRKIRGGWRYGA